MQMHSPTTVTLNQLAMLVKHPIYIDGLLIDNLLKRVSNPLNTTAATLLKFIYPFLDERQKDHILSTLNDNLSTVDLALLFVYNHPIELLVHQALLRINAWVDYDFYSCFSNQTKYHFAQARYFEAVSFLRKNRSKIPNPLKRKLCNTFKQQFLFKKDAYHQALDDFNGYQLPLLLVADELDAQEALKIINAISNNFEAYLRSYSESPLFQLMTVLVDKVTLAHLDASIKGLEKSQHVAKFRCLNQLLKKVGNKPLTFIDNAKQLSNLKSSLVERLDQTYVMIKNLSLTEKMELISHAKSFIIEELSIDNEDLGFFILLTMHYAVQTLLVSEDFSQNEKDIISQQQQDILQKLMELEPFRENADESDSEAGLSGFLKTHCDFLGHLAIPFPPLPAVNQCMPSHFQRALQKKHTFSRSQNKEDTLHSEEANALQELLQAHITINNTDDLLNQLQNQYTLIQQKYNKPNYFQRLFGLNNTWQWQKESKHFRRFALKQFQNALNGLSTREKKQLISKAQTLKLFNEPRDNFTFSDKTDAIIKLEDLAKDCGKIDLQLFA